MDGGLFAMNSESRGLEEDETINDAIPQLGSARSVCTLRRGIEALTGTKYTTLCLFFVLFSFFRRKGRELEMRRCLGRFSH